MGKQQKCEGVPCVFGSCDLPILRLITLDTRIYGHDGWYIFKETAIHSKAVLHLSSDQNPGYLLYRGDYTTQLYGDCINYKNPY